MAAPPPDTAADRIAAIGRPRSRRRRRLVDNTVVASLVGCAVFSVAVTFAIVGVLFQQTAGFFGIHGNDTPGAPNAAVADAPPPRSETPDIRISEIRLDEPGREDGRAYAEVAGEPGTPLAGLTLVVLSSGTSNPGVVLTTADLGPVTLDSDGVAMVAGEPRVLGRRADIAAPLALGNEATHTFLLVRGFATARGADLDTDDDGDLDLEPWESVVDAIGLLSNADHPVYADRAMGPWLGGKAPVHVLRDGQTGGWTYGSAAVEHVTLTEFFGTTEWNPLLGAEKHFGVWPLVAGTLLVTAVAACVALPIGLITAIYLSEYAPSKLRQFLKPVLEILAGIPTVVYGFFALTVITPFLRLPVFQLLWGEFSVYNAGAAGIAVGIMTLPIVTSLSEDALRAVPRSLREGGYALGGTKFDVSVKIVTPAALSGIVAAFLLAIARAVGETMIVALAAGGLAQLTADPRNEVQTMTAYMVQIFLGDASNFGPEYYSSYAVAATLFLMTLVLTLLGARVLKRFREVYE